MSSIGIDFGNESCVVAVARNCGIDIILTEESKYETPTTVCFGKKQRFFGAAGASSAMTNPKNTISHIKCLVGRKFSDPNLQRNLQHFPFSVTEGPDGFPLIHVTYRGDQHTFTPTQVLAMVLAHLKKLSERNLSGTVSDCCIGIPVFFTDIQRSAVLDAAKIAGLNAPLLIHEMTAVALGYGIYKTDLPKSDKLNVAFVDVGHASMQVCIVEYKSGHLKILGHAFDQSLGGRDFDRALFEHFAAKFEKEHNVDVSRNVRACAQLMSECEKTKKVLSANPVAHINIECLMNEKDMSYEIKREEFKEISGSLFQRVVDTLKMACETAQLDGQSIHEVELVGSGSRVPEITIILKKFFKKEPRRTINSSECVARGCALCCASRSPTFQVWELKVEESFSFSTINSGIHAGDSSVTEFIAAASANVQAIKMDLEPKGKVKVDVLISEHIYGGLSSLDLQNALEKECDMACKDKVVLETKERKNALEAYVYKIREQLNGKYQDFVEERERESVDNKLQETEDWLYNEGEDEDKDAYVAKLEVLTKLATPIEVRYGEDLHRQDVINHLVQCLNDCRGICSEDRIDPAKMNEVSVKCSSVEQWLNAQIEQQIQLPKYVNPVLLCANLKNTADELRSFCDQIMPKPNSAPRKMVNGVAHIHEGTAAKSLPVQADLEKAVEKECAMNYQPMEEPKRGKMVLKAHVYNMRELHGKYKNSRRWFDNQRFARKLKKTEDWLSSVGEEVDEGVYIAKLDELVKLDRPFKVCNEVLQRETSLNFLIYSLYYYGEIACSVDPQWNHVDPAERQKIINECSNVNYWLHTCGQHQTQLQKLTEHIDRFCWPRVSKARREHVSDHLLDQNGNQQVQDTNQPTTS